MVLSVFIGVSLLREVRAGFNNRPDTPPSSHRHHPASAIARLYALQATILHLTRSSLHRCLQRHGISRLPEIEGDKEPKKRFKSYPIGFFHLDIAEVQTAEGKLYLFVAIDRTSKFAFVQLVESANRVTASAFLVALIAAVPYKVHTILTDNGIQFRYAPRYANGPTARYITHMFAMRCRENGIEHRFTKINHPWTNGQVERMNRTIKEATVKRYHYDSHAQLERHLNDFVSAYNFGRRLKTLKGLTPYEFICKWWTSEPQRFSFDPIHQMPGLNTYCPLADLDAAEYDSQATGSWTRGLLIRRHLVDGDLAFFSTWCPTGTDTATLVKVEGHRWAIEDSFETGKNELGLDHNETRSWHGWHRHVSLVMLVFAMMAVIRHHANKAPPPKTIRRMSELLRC